MLSVSEQFDGVSASGNELALRETHRSEDFFAGVTGADFEALAGGESVGIGDSVGAAEADDAFEAFGVDPSLDSIFGLRVNDLTLQVLG